MLSKLAYKIAVLKSFFRSSLATQESLMVPPNHPVVQQVTQQVPQEVSAMSAMSEQDLISYINPSAFDQGNYLLLFVCIHNN